MHKETVPGFNYDIQLSMIAKKHYKTTPTGRSLKAKLSRFKRISRLYEQGADSVGIGEYVRLWAKWGMSWLGGVWIYVFVTSRENLYPLWERCSNPNSKGCIPYGFSPLAFIQNYAGAICKIAPAHRHFVRRTPNSNPLRGKC